MTASGEKPVAVVGQGAKVKQGDKITFKDSSAKESDVKAIEKIEYLIDDELVYTATKAPFAFDTASLAAGRYEIIEKIIYKNGKIAQQAKTITATGGLTNEKVPQLDEPGPASGKVRYWVAGALSPGV